MRKCLLALFSVALTACASTGPVARAAQAQQNTAVVLAFLDMVFNRHDVETAFKLYVGTEYRQHNPTVADGKAGAIQGLTRVTHETYPELRQEVKRTISQGDLVAVHSRCAMPPIAAAAGGLLSLICSGLCMDVSSSTGM